MNHPFLKKMTDKEIVKKALEDVNYFSKIIERYENKLRTYIIRITNIETNEVNDILQEVFVKAWKNLESFKDTLKFSSWIYRIAHNETINYYKKHIKRDAEKRLNLTSEEVENIATDIDMNKVLNYQLVVEQVSNLPGELREIIILFYFENKDYQEISDIIKIPIGSVSTKLAKAKNILYEKLHHLKDEV